MALPTAPQGSASRAAQDETGAIYIPAPRGAYLTNTWLEDGEVKFGGGWPVIAYRISGPVGQESATPIALRIGLQGPNTSMSNGKRWWKDGRCFDSENEWKASEIARLKPMAAPTYL